MDDIFISYKSERRQAAAHLAKILERYGYSVWYDYALVKGAGFAAQIDAKIREAKAVVVLWCSMSVRSEWVNDEAALAAELGSLVPAKIEPCDLLVDMRRKDYVDLTAWNGGPFDYALHPLLDAIKQKAGRAPQLDYDAMREYDQIWRGLGAPSLKAFGLEAAVKEDRKLQDHPVPSVPSGNGSGPALSLANHNHAGEDWKLIEHSADPRDFRAFIEEHKSGFLVRKAQHRLGDLADGAFAGAGRDKGELERFLKAHFDSAHAEAARTLLAELAAEERAQREAEERSKRDEAARKAEGERKRQAQEAGYRAEGRLRIGPAIARPAGLEWFLPGAGKAEGFKDADFAPEMVIVPAGEFWMGSTDAEIAKLGKEYKDAAEWFKCEAPRHRVTIAKPFAIGRLAVTFEEWEAAQKDKDWQRITGRAPYSPSDQSWGKGRRPAINVCWDDAKAYVKWLSAKTGMDYMLPSEAEWEYACRAGTQTAFWWDDTISTAQANYDGNYVYLGGQKGEYRQKTVPVDDFQANPWGLYQVHGNVWEWCEDCWNGNYHNAPADGTVWTTGDSSRRVLRGGSWNHFPLLCRSAIRNWNPADDRGNVVGFRVARTLS